MTKPTIGYIGLDHHHTEPYLKSLKQLPASVTSICEPDESFDDSALEDHLGDPPMYRDPIELLDTEAPDVAWMTLSNRDTPDAIEAALDRDIDVYTEKPAARTAADLQPLAERDTESTVCFLSMESPPCSQGNPRSCCERLLRAPSSVRDAVCRFRA